MNYEYWSKRLGKMSSNKKCFVPKLGMVKTYHVPISGKRVFLYKVNGLSKVGCIDKVRSELLRVCSN